MGRSSLRQQRRPTIPARGSSTYSGAMTNITVTVDDTHLRSIGTVARSLEESGVDIEEFFKLERAVTFKLI